MILWVQARKYFHVLSLVCSAGGFAAPPLPLYLEPNRGQAGAHAQFVARGERSTFYLTGAEMVAELRGQSPLRMRVLGVSPLTRGVG